MIVNPSTKETSEFLVREEVEIDTGKSFSSWAVFENQCSCFQDKGRKKDEDYFGNKEIERNKGLFLNPICFFLDDKYILQTLVT